jgi:hypothetical protein
MSGLTIDLPPELVEDLAERVARILAADSTPPEPWVTVKDAAAHLACKPQRVYDLCSRRDATRLPHRKDGSRLLFRLSELDRYLEAQ